MARRWFSPVTPSEVRSPLNYRVATTFVTTAGRLCGAPLPRPIQARIDRPGPVVDWAAETLRRHGACLVITFVSLAMRACAVARKRGSDLTGATFMAGGEPPAPTKVALLPLFLVVLGLGEAPKLLVVALAAFFPSVISAMAGVRQISPIHFEVARNYQAGRWRTLTHVVLPGSLPMVLTGSRVALNSAVVVTIAVELAQSRDGIGHLLWIAGETLRVEELYAAVAVAALLGISFNVVLRLLSSRLVPWQTEHQV